MKEFLNFPSSKISWFRCGGILKKFYIVETFTELKKALENNTNEKFLTIGAGSNILFCDDFDGIVIKLSGEFSDIKVENNGIIAGAGAFLKQVVNFSVKSSFVGAEFLYTIPGSVGGGVKMNAGCFGGEIKDILKSIDILADGEIKTILRKNINFEYRNSHIDDDVVILRAIFELKKGNDNEIAESEKKIKEMNEYRKQNQVVGFTCGSTFANPIDKNGKKLSAWKLIDEVGLRGFEIGGAKFSEKHCNFIVNYDNATAKDIVKLIELAKKRVFEKFDIELKLEVKII